MNINIFLGLSIPVNRRMYAGKDPSQLSQLGPSCTAYHNHLSIFFSILLYVLKHSHEMLNWTAIFDSMREIAQKYQNDISIKIWTVLFSNVWIFLSASPEIWSYADAHHKVWRLGKVGGFHHTFIKLFTSSHKQ